MINTKLINPYLISKDGYVSDLDLCMTFSYLSPCVPLLAPISTHPSMPKGVLAYCVSTPVAKGLPLLFNRNKTWTGKMVS